MGLMDIFKRNGNTPTAQETPSYPTPAPAPAASSGGGLLDLSKGETLDLSKTGADLSRLRGAAGWKIKQGAGDYDLDLFALLLDEKDVCQKCVYYGDKHAKGVQLDHDNLTGSSEGVDDENIFINLSEVKNKIHKIKLCVAIYDARSRGQCFKHVNGAYVRLVDESNGEREVCRFNMSDGGGDNTVVVCADIYRNGGSWTFQAVGDYYKASIDDMKHKFGG